MFFLCVSLFLPLKPALSRLKLAVSLLWPKGHCCEFNCELIITEENSIKRGQKKYYYTPKMLHNGNARLQVVFYKLRVR